LQIEISYLRSLLASTLGGGGNLHDSAALIQGNSP